MAYPCVYPTIAAVAPTPTFGMPGHHSIRARGPVMPRPVAQPHVVALQQGLAYAGVHPAAVAAERRVQRLALALLLTVVLLGMPLAAFLAAMATH